MNEKPPICNFCDTQTARLLIGAGAGVYICNDCIFDALQMVNEKLGPNWRDIPAPVRFVVNKDAVQSSNTMPQHDQKTEVFEPSETFAHLFKDGKVIKNGG